MTGLTLAPPFEERRDAALPSCAVGIGLRADHYGEIGTLLAEPGSALPVDFLEIHAENYLHPGSPAHRLLIDVARRVPLSVHSIGLSLGSVDSVDKIHLDRVAALVEDCAPLLISDHLAWCRVGGRYLNDLLPLPYTSEALQILSENIDRVQSRLGRQILLENPSTYLAFPESDWAEGVFMAEVLKRTGCGLLLDINNIYVSAHNQGVSPADWLESYPLAAAKEIHLAGHTERDGLLIDTHAAPVCAEVWRLYEAVLTKIGPRPTLIEWDADLPPLATLLAEAGAARERMPG